MVTVQDTDLSARLVQVCERDGYPEGSVALMDRLYKALALARHSPGAEAAKAEMFWTKAERERRAYAARVEAAKARRLQQAVTRERRADARFWRSLAAGPWRPILPRHRVRQLGYLEDARGHLPEDYRLGMLILAAAVEAGDL